MIKNISIIELEVSVDIPRCIIYIQIKSYSIINDLFKDQRILKLNRT